MAFTDWLKKITGGGKQTETPTAAPPADEGQVPQQPPITAEGKEPVAPPLSPAPEPAPEEEIPAIGSEVASTGQPSVEVQPDAVGSPEGVQPTTPEGAAKPPTDTPSTGEAQG